MYINKIFRLRTVRVDERKAVIEILALLIIIQFSKRFTQEIKLFACTHYNNL